MKQQLKLEALESLRFEYQSIEIKPIQISNHRNNKDKKRKHKKKRKHSSSSSSQTSSSSPSRSSSSLQSLSHYSKHKQKQDKQDKKLLDFTIDPCPPKKDYLIEYEQNGQRKKTSMKNLNEKMLKVLTLQGQEQQEEDIKENDGLKQNSHAINSRQHIKDELELGINRYYQQNPFEYCFRCKQIGHQERQCTEQQVVYCNYCLSKSHSGDKCLNISCFKCNKYGHRKQECKAQLLLSFCPYCSKSSHKDTECGMLIPLSTNRNSEAICLYCKETGHVNCSSMIS